MSVNSYFENKAGSDLANLCVTFANLTDEQSTAVKRCINGYAKQDSLMGKIVQSLYLFLEAYRSSHSQSDWQRAQKALEDKAFTIIPFSRSWIGEECIQAVSHKALKELVRLNETKIKLPQGVTPFVAKQCNVDEIVHLTVMIAQQCVVKNLPPLDQTLRRCTQFLGNSLSKAAELYRKNYGV